MSKYRITLDGKIYEMEVELVQEGVVEPPSDRNEYKEFNNNQRDANINVVDPQTQKQTQFNEGVVLAPMPGTVIRVEKQEGDTVKSGELVLVLEAMKMENEIVAPFNGTLKILHCGKGKCVDGGEALFEVE